MAILATWDSKTQDLVQLHAEAHRAVLVVGAPRAEPAVVLAVAKELMRAGTIDREAVIKHIYQRDPIVKALNATTKRRKKR